MSASAKVYGIADKAWQVVVGCDPKMPCAPRCWARRTVARVVECQGDKAREVFQIALTPDKQKWSGVVSLDENHLRDPLGWRKPALIATGFHGDCGRLDKQALDRILAVMGLSPQHRFLPLTKCADRVAEYLQGAAFSYIRALMDQPDWISLPAGRSFPRWPQSWPMVNVNIGCSVMNQSEADRMREPMAQIAALGWSTHVWYEPAIGPVNWNGWEFLRGMISGGESGANSRPSHPQWHRDTRDWCVSNGIPYNLKQWGDWTPICNDSVPYGEFHGAGNWVDSCLCAEGSQAMYRVGKKAAGRMLYGRTWDGIPEFGEVRK